MFVLGNIGGNLFTYLTPLWVVTVFAILVCAISAFSLVYGIAWLRDGMVTRRLAIGCVALSLISGVGVILRFPQEMDPSAIELSATMGVDRSQYAASVAQAATMALEAPESSARLAYAKIAFQMTGRTSRYRDESGSLVAFVADADLLRSVEEAKKSEARMKAAIDDYVANGFQREMVKSLALLTFIVSAGVGAYAVKRPKVSSTA
jgi:hypothetical protein